MAETAQTGKMLQELLRSGWPVDSHAPWPRAIVQREGWRQAAQLLSRGEFTLLGLWSDREQVHIAVDDNGSIGVLSFVCEEGRFPSIGRSHPPAVRLERAVRDLWGFEPRGLARTPP